MSTIQVDPSFLEIFEEGFNPHEPEKSTTPTKVLGYGEISTVLEILTEDMQGLAFKRMPMFESEDEVEPFLDTYQQYLDVLENQIDLNLVPSETIWIKDISKFID